MVVADPTDGLGSVLCLKAPTTPGYPRRSQRAPCQTVARTRRGQRKANPQRRPSYTELRSNTDHTEGGSVNVPPEELESPARPPSDVVANRQALLDGVALVLAEMVSGSCTKAGVGEDVMVFHSSMPPKISMAFYLARIHRLIPLSDASFILPLVYISRLQQVSPEVLQETSWVRLLITGIMLSSKFLDDEADIHFNSAAYAKVGGLAVQELEKLEAVFCRHLEWRFFATEEEYARFHRRVYSFSRLGM